jgi:hypothetical protein
MGRRRKLSDFDDGPLDDPNAAWRDDPATVRQKRRLDFFEVPYCDWITKGDAADLIDSIEPTLEQLEDYQDWKSHGEPNIAQWKRLRVGDTDGKTGRNAARRRNKKSSGCGCVLLAVLCLAAMVALIDSIPEMRRSKGVEAPAPTNSKKAPIPATIAPKFAKTAADDAILATDMTVSVQFGTVRFLKGEPVKMLERTPDGWRVSADGVEFLVSADQIAQ